MHTKIQRLVLLGMLVGGLLVALSTPANAATNQISGVAVLDTTGACPAPPAGFADFTDFTQVMAGSLDGCWYTKIETTKDNGAPSGVYIESGEEVFVGSLNGGPVRYVLYNVQVRVQVGSGRVDRLRGPRTLPAPNR